MSIRVERARSARHAAQKQKRALALLGLAMGKPNCCFENSTHAVWAHPDRLRFVEGFYIHNDFLCHHAWVIDKLTGTRHELTIRNQDPDAVYIGKEFTRAELKDPYGDLIEHPKLWAPQLTLQDQFAMLTAAGYDVELGTHLWDHEKNEMVDFGPIVDMSKVDTYEPDSFNDLNLEMGIDLDGEETQQWEYEWRIKETTNAETRGAAAVA
jgi:hypothetical protein